MPAGLLGSSLKLLGQALLAPQPEPCACLEVQTSGGRCRGRRSEQRNALTLRGLGSWEAPKSAHH